MRANGHKDACPCIKCSPWLWQRMNQRRPLATCPKHGEQKIRRPDGTVHCRACVRQTKASRKKREATRLASVAGREEELYRRAAEVREQRRKP